MRTLRLGGHVSWVLLLVWGCEGGGGKTALPASTPGGSPQVPEAAILAALASPTPTNLEPEDPTLLELARTRRPGESQLEALLEVAGLAPDTALGNGRAANAMAAILRLPGGAPAEALRALYPSLSRERREMLLLLAAVHAREVHRPLLEDAQQDPDPALRTLASRAQTEQASKAAAGGAR